MSVVRAFAYGTDNVVPQSTLRVMDTTCPRCKEHVQFALSEDEYIKDENDFRKRQNTELRNEIHRLNLIINKLIGVKT